MKINNIAQTKMYLSHYRDNSERTIQNKSLIQPAQLSPLCSICSPSWPRVLLLFVTVSMLLGTRSNTFQLLHVLPHSTKLKRHRFLNISNLPKRHRSTLLHKLIKYSKHAKFSWLQIASPQNDPCPQGSNSGYCSII